MKINFIAKAIFLVAFLFDSALAQENALLHREIRWQDALEIPISDQQKVKVPYFENAQQSGDNLPTYFENIRLNTTTTSVNVELIDARFQPMKDLKLIPSKFQVANDVVPASKIGYQKKHPYVAVSFSPFRKSASGIVEQLVSFDLKITPTGSATPLSGARHYTHNSVLASGSWYKIAVSQDGVYKLNYHFLKGLGIDVDHIDPRSIKIYGNGGGMLPLPNSGARYDDLQENAIYVEGENDGRLNLEDYVLFYGQNPTRWTYNASDRKFHHQLNLYSDSTYYFITVDNGNGKRIQLQDSLAASPTSVVSSFDNYSFHEAELSNLIHSGRQWFGEQFDVINNHNSFEFGLPNLVPGEQVKLNADAVGRATAAGSSCSFTFFANGQNVSSIGMGSLYGVPYWSNYAYENSVVDSFLSVAPVISMAVQFASNDNSAVGWLNYIELNARCQLDFSGVGSQLQFRDSRSTGTGQVAQYHVSNVDQGMKIWDVSDPLNVSDQKVTIGGSGLTFTLASDVLHQFVAFNGSGFLSAKAIGKVENQNLHALPQTQMIILTHPNFISSANELADFHRTHDHLSVIVVTNEQVYNEFSSGAPDVSAIRDMMKMFYDRSLSTFDLPKYLLFMGDASYDNKNRSSSNTNFILSYQSESSLVWINSYISDDFFCFLDDNEGQWNPNDNDLPDIGIGRLPVKSTTEADAVVRKIISYSATDATEAVNTTQCAQQGSSVFGDWRNLVTFVGDDQDGNTHFNNSQELADTVRRNYPVYNVDKIYLDAYKQETTPGGQRYPDARKAIVDRVQRGTLLITYIGHGGEVGWAHERVLEVEDINTWSNSKSLAAFLTATCEFSRVDDPARTSAGEMVLLNPNGGGIGLFTTSRLALAGANQTLAKAFFRHFFEPVNGKMPTMGEIFEQTKIDVANNLNTRNFLLLGDPALTLAYPGWNIKTNSINSVSVDAVPDTIRALSITITGEVQDRSGHKLTSFNGVIYPTIYDKKVTYYTLGNDADNTTDSDYPAPFVLQKNVLYRGKASVQNGDFTFTFVVPKDISFQYGYGRLSYYAANGTEDANGYFENIVIGGVDTAAAADKKGPDVKVYMNDDKFVFGGMTDENPSLYAVVNDQNGINTIGNGIGHDITAQLDNANSQIYVLNDYYQSDLNNYQKGSVLYKLSDLSEGRHSVKFKVWDVYNNSSEAYTEFIVSSSAVLALDHVLNYPNPFTTHTRFMFEYNCACTSIEVMVQIFTVSGKLVKTIDQHIQTEGYRSDQVEWDGLDDYGDRIGRGVYIYKLRVKLSDHKFAEKFEKLVLLK